MGVLLDRFGPLKALDKIIVLGTNKTKTIHS
jgi:hypothetical protein